MIGVYYCTGLYCFGAVPVCACVGSRVNPQSPPHNQGDGLGTVIWREQKPVEEMRKWGNEEMRWVWGVFKQVG